MEEKKIEEGKTEKEENKPESIIEKAERLNRELDEKIKSFNEEKSKFETEKAEFLLAGTAGGNVKSAPKELTPKEYKDKVMRGEI